MPSRATTLLQQTIRSSGLSQGEIARRVQLTPGAISKYLSGDSMPSIEAFEKILAVCGASIELRQDSADPVAPVAAQIREMDEELQASVRYMVQAMGRLAQMEPGQRRLMLRQLKGWADALKEEP